MNNLGALVVDDWLDYVETNNHAVLYRCRLSPQLTDEVVPALVALLQSSDNATLLRTLAALHRIGPAAEQAVIGVRPLLDHHDAKVQNSAIQVLSHVGLDAPELVVPMLLQKIEGTDANVEALLFAFIHLGSKAAAGLPLVFRAFKSSSGHIRRLALRCLEAIGTPEAAATPLLAVAQTDRNAAVRAMALSLTRRYAGV